MANAKMFKGLHTKLLPQCFFISFLGMYSKNK